VQPHGGIATVLVVRARPSGTVTFVFTDIEGSTRRWEQDAEVMRDALAAHDEIVSSAIERHDGVVFATGGDGFAAAFGRAADALACSASAQAELQATDLPAVRMGVHTGEAVERGGDYFGPAVNRAARLMAVAHGGQVVVSGATQHRLRRTSCVARGAAMSMDELVASTVATLDALIEATP
jgi:class 3 adenylate cyclase